MSIEKPLISFCIPTFNRSVYLKKCIESVIGYEGDDIEIIIQDNCSPDNTTEVVYSFDDKRVKYFRNETNIGPIRNFSVIIENAKGEYVYLLTDDDMLIPGSIDLLKAFIYKNKPKAFKTALIMFLEKTYSSLVYSFTKTDKIYPEINITDTANIILYSHIYTGLCFEASLYDKNFISLHENNWYPSMALIGCAGREIGFLSYPTAIHIWENETFWGISPEKRDALNKGQVNIFKSLLDHNKIDKDLYFEICRLHILKFPNINHEEMYDTLTSKQSSLIKKHLSKLKIELAIKSFLFKLKNKYFGSKL